MGSRKNKRSNSFVVVTVSCQSVARFLILKRRARRLT